MATRKTQSSVPVGVIAQIRRAFKREHRLATIVGFLLGGFVPLAVYVVSHREAGALAFNGSWSLVAGGLVYSAQTVFQWARLAFQQALKSVGFCVLLEGVMVTSHTHWLSLVALAFLISINGIATGCTLSVGAPRRA